MSGRLALVALVALALAADPVAAAAPLDPTETVGAGRIRLDGEADLVLRRDLRFEDAGGRRESEGRTFLLSGSYGLLPELDGFLTLGASRLRLQEENALPSGRFNGDVGLAFGGGLRYRFLDQRLLKVGAQLGLARLESEDGGVTASWIEYDLVLATSLHTFRSLVPYVGLGASIVNGQFEGPFGRLDFRQENAVGAVVGVRYAATAQVKASLAARLFDQTTVAFALSFGF